MLMAMNNVYRTMFEQKIHLTLKKINERIFDMMWDYQLITLI